jgi:hypothetical protein
MHGTVDFVGIGPVGAGSWTEEKEIVKREEKEERWRDKLAATKAWSKMVRDQDDSAIRFDELKPSDDALEQ